MQKYKHGLAKNNLFIVSLNIHKIAFIKLSLQKKALQIIHAAYIISSPKLELCPEPNMPEYAFIGRSNVGKSSLINLLCNKAQLAKTSGAPGKTQLINHFEVISKNEKEQQSKWYLVDLPGYGYAKVGKGQRKSWQKMIADYLQKRENLKQIFILIDSRHKAQKIDIEFINQLGEWQKPFCIVFTKTDKENQRVVSSNIKTVMQELAKTWEELPGYFLTSAVKRRGAKEILNAIEQLNSI
jgi:GTP-binding protein